MATDTAKAATLKDQGNAAFKACQWDKAVDFYTQAIEINPNEKTFFTNRAQAQLKLEAYGLAINDATKAIELDNAFTKAYYRRAVANTAVLRHKDALRDWRVVVKRLPGDAGAKTQCSECERIVKRDAFLKAIDVGEMPSAAEGLDIESLSIENDYDGAKLGSEMTQEFIDDMIQRFKDGKRLHKKYVYQIILAVKDIVYAEPTMVEMEIMKENKLTVCGDTHGQYFDLLNIFETNGFPSESHGYLFNGDFVDRGSWSTEIALLLYAYKWLRPSNFFLNRGNHETDDMNRMYGFEGECKHKYNERTFKLFSESFSALPLATLIGKKFFTLHGGLFSDDKVSLDDIRKLNRHSQRQPGQAGLMMEMLWTDPQKEPGRGPSKRGVGLQFGPDVTKRFCENNGLEAVIRSHEVRMEGYEEEHDGRCVTSKSLEFLGLRINRLRMTAVFSAPNYCDSTANKGAFINIESDYKLQFKQFDAVPHPDIRPMAVSLESRHTTYNANMFHSMLEIVQWQA
jgi:serine/threonine-protein phosphatase 5